MTRAEPFGMCRGRWIPFTADLYKMLKKRHCQIQGWCFSIWVMFILGFPHVACGMSITLTWNPLPPGQADGYRLFYRLPGEGYNYTQPAWQGSATSCTLFAMQDVTTHFVVRAYQSYRQSSDSHEATYYSLASDMDGDGMPDGWEVRHGFNPLVDDAFADPDGDGFCNGREFVGGSDPKNRLNAPPVSAIYVDGGNSGTENGTKEHPFKTIQKGINFSGAGDTVTVAAGNYGENLLIQREVYLSGENAALTFIDGGNDTKPAIRCLNLSNGRIEGFHLKNGTGASIQCDQAVLSIEGNIVSNTKSGHGIRVDSGSSATIRNTIIYQNSSDGISVGNGTANVFNNTIVHNSGTGISCLSGTGVSLKNNIIAYNEGYGILCGASPAPVISHNDLWSNVTGTYSGCGPGEADITVDPLFKDDEANDYHLTYASRCIDAGESAVVGPADADCDGEPRMLDGDVDGSVNVDLGADEFLGDPFIETISYNRCISELCVSAIVADAYDPHGGVLSYSWEPLDGGTILGSGGAVEFQPKLTGPHPCPYRVKVVVTSSVSGLSAEQMIGIDVRLAGDTDGNGTVDVLDSDLVGHHFGERAGEPAWEPRADVNCDNVVNLLDHVMVLGQFGQTACSCLAR